MLRLLHTKLSRAGLSIVDALDACRNVTGLAQLLDRELANARKAGHAGAGAERVALLRYGGNSAGGSGAGYDARVAEVRSKLGSDLSAVVVREPGPQPPSIVVREARPAEPSILPAPAVVPPKPAPAWDVFDAVGTKSSVLVFTQQEKLK